jgi:predicted Zn-ribbon and HTH transcriptional regulator
MSIYLKTCKKCGEKFDIGINMDLCPNCRLKKINKRGREDGKFD